MAALPALAGLLHYLRHPGLAFYDELYTAGWIHLVLDGQWPVPTFRSGFLSNLLSAAWSLLWPRNELWLQALPSLALGLEILLLARLTASMAGAPAGLAAAALTALSAFSQLRARTLLAFTYTPLALLALLLWLPSARRHRGLALCWGLAAGCGLLQYEAWIAALLVLAWALARSRRESGAHWAWLVLGFALSAGAIFASWPYAKEYWTERSALGTLSPGGSMLQRLGALGVLFLGRPGAQELGAWPLFPCWALPLLAAGLWKALRRSQPLLLAWAVLGLLPLAASGDGFQARRAIAGLPALFALAGIGLGPLLSRYPKQVIGLCLLAGLAEGLALDRALAHRDLAAYAPARRCVAMAKALAQGAKPGTRALVATGGNDPAPSAFYLPAGTDGSAPWVLVPGSYSAPRPDPALGSWLEVRVPGAAPEYWLQPEPGDVQRWQERDELGWRLRLAFHRGGKREVIRLASTELSSLQDPWARTQCLEALVRAAVQLHGPGPAVLQSLEEEPLVSSSPHLVAAAWLAARDPAGALRLTRRATALDPRRGKAWLLQAQLAQVLGLKAESQEALRRAASADPDF